MRNVFFAILFLLSFYNSFAQVEDTSVFQYPIEMDAVVISAAKSGWDVQAFIKRIQKDTTFYKAFKSIRIIPFTAENDIEVYNKKGKVIASYFSRTKQHRKNNCRSMDVLVEDVTGDFYKKNKEYRYYTAELYAYLIFTEGVICNETDIVAGALDDRGSGQLEKSKYQLKQLLFNPGSKIAGVPLMGNKAAIFEPEVAKMYDFQLNSEMYDGEECYVFKAVPKPQYKDDVVYNNLATWFRKSDYSIVARDYSLSYNTLVYDFDVHMKVRTRQINGKLLPTDIWYDGNWDVIGKRRERVKFSTKFSY